ncbi:hypothetical protein OQA88_11791 [Cercophora sp. LCS_1]
MADTRSRHDDGGHKHSHPRHRPPPLNNVSNSMPAVPIVPATPSRAFDPMGYSLSPTARHFFQTNFGADMINAFQGIGRMAQEFSRTFAEKAGQTSPTTYNIPRLRRNSSYTPIIDLPTIKWDDMVAELSRNVYYDPIQAHNLFDSPDTPIASSPIATTTDHPHHLLSHESFHQKDHQTLSPTSHARTAFYTAHPHGFTQIRTVSATRAIYQPLSHPSSSPIQIELIRQPSDLQIVPVRQRIQVTPTIDIRIRLNYPRSAAPPPQLQFCTLDDPLVQHRLPETIPAFPGVYAFTRDAPDPDGSRYWKVYSAAHTHSLNALIHHRVSQGNRFSEPEIWDVIAQLGRAYAYLHTGVIISPSGERRRRQQPAEKWEAISHGAGRAQNVFVELVPKGECEVNKSKWRVVLGDWSQVSRPAHDVCKELGTCLEEHVTFVDKMFLGVLIGQLVYGRAVEDGFFGPDFFGAREGFRWEALVVDGAVEGYSEELVGVAKRFGDLLRRSHTADVSGFVVWLRGLDEEERRAVVPRDGWVYGEMIDLADRMCERARGDGVLAEEEDDGFWETKVVEGEAGVEEKEEEKAPQLATLTVSSPEPQPEPEPEPEPKPNKPHANDKKKRTRPSSTDDETFEDEAPLPAPKKARGQKPKLADEGPARAKPKPARPVKKARRRASRDDDYQEPVRRSTRARGPREL